MSTPEKIEKFHTENQTSVEPQISKDIDDSELSTYSERLMGDKNIIEHVSELEQPQKSSERKGESVKVPNKLTQAENQPTETGECHLQLQSMEQEFDIDHVEHSTARKCTTSRSETNIASKSDRELAINVPSDIVHPASPDSKQNDKETPECSTLEQVQSYTLQAESSVPEEKTNNLPLKTEMDTYTDQTVEKIMPLTNIHKTEIDTLENLRKYEHSLPSTNDILKQPQYEKVFPEFTSAEKNTLEQVETLEKEVTSEIEDNMEPKRMEGQSVQDKTDKYIIENKDLQMGSMVPIDKVNNVSAEEVMSQLSTSTTSPDVLKSSEYNAIETGHSMINEFAAGLPVNLNNQETADVQLATDNQKHLVVDTQLLILDANLHSVDSSDSKDIDSKVNMLKQDEGPVLNTELTSQIMGEMKPIGIVESLEPDTNLKKDLTDMSVPIVMKEPILQNNIHNEQQMGINYAISKADNIVGALSNGEKVHQSQEPCSTQLDIAEKIPALQVEHTESDQASALEQKQKGISDMYVTGSEQPCIYEKAIQQDKEFGNTCEVEETSKLVPHAIPDTQTSAYQTSKTTRHGQGLGNTHQEGHSMPIEESHVLENVKDREKPIMTKQTRENIPDDQAPFLQPSVQGNLPDSKYADDLPQKIMPDCSAKEANDTPLEHPQSHSLEVGILQETKMVYDTFSPHEEKPVLADIKKTEGTMSYPDSAILQSIKVGQGNILAETHDMDDSAQILSCEAKPLREHNDKGHQYHNVSQNEGSLVIPEDTGVLENTLPAETKTLPTELSCFESLHTLDKIEKQSSAMSIKNSEELCAPLNTLQPRQITADESKDTPTSIELKSNEMGLTNQGDNTHTLNPTPLNPIHALSPTTVLDNNGVLDICKKTSKQLGTLVETDSTHELQQTNDTEVDRQVEQTKENIPTEEHLKMVELLVGVSCVSHNNNNIFDFC